MGAAAVSLQLLRVCASGRRCAHLMERTRVPRLLPLLYHSSLYSDTLACCLFAFSLSPSHRGSIHPSLLVSIPPTPSCWPLPARSPRGKLPELGHAVRQHCNAPLCSARTAHTHTDTHTCSVDMAWYSMSLWAGVLLWKALACVFVPVCV